MSPTAEIRQERHSYGAMKDSGVEWLGKIPAHWNTKRLKFLVSEPLKYGANEPAESDDYGLPRYIRITDIDEHGRLREETFRSIPEQAARPYWLEEGDLLLARSGATIGKSFYYEPAWGRAAYAGYLIRARFIPMKMMPRFAMYFTNSYQYWQWLNSSFIQSTIQNVNAEKYSNLSVPFAPIREQRDIIAFLDRETAQIDALIEKKRCQIELLQEKRAALISNAVTKGLDPNAMIKDSGVEWLGEVPSHWQVPPLYARFSVELGKMLDEKRITGENLLPYVRNVDVQWDKVNITDLPEMDIKPNEYPRYTLNAGDVLVCEGGEVGRTAVWGGELAVCAFQKAIHRLRPITDQDLPRFLYYVMEAAAFTGVFIAQGNPNTIPHLTAEKLRVYRFPFPPTEEQRAIVDFLDRETSKIDVLVEKINFGIDRLREYRTALISAAVTGKIDVREEAA